MNKNCEKIFFEVRNLKKNIEKTVASLFISYACRLIHSNNFFHEYQLFPSWIPTVDIQLSIQLELEFLMTFDSGICIHFFHHFLGLADLIDDHHTIRKAVLETLMNLINNGNGSWRHKELQCCAVF
jgi:hypothetical protein